MNLMRRQDVLLKNVIACIRVKDELEAELDYVDNPQFIPCDEDDDQYFNLMDPHSFFDADSCNYVSTTACSNCSFSSEIDRQVEEFIATFYQQMRLQRQESYGKFQEMLARGSS